MVNGSRRRVRRSNALANQRGQGLGNRVETWETVLLGNGASPNPVNLTAGKLGLDLTRPIKLARLVVQAMLITASQEPFPVQVVVQNTNSGPLASPTVLVNTSAAPPKVTVRLPTTEPYRIWAANDVVATVNFDQGATIGVVSRLVVRTSGYIGTQEYQTNTI